MHKYHFDVHINEKRGNNAGSKATSDCKTILLKNGFKDLQISFVKTWYLLPWNLLKLFSTLIFYFIIIRSGSWIVVQYPLLGINAYSKYFIKLLQCKGCKFCCIIHDLDSLRGGCESKKVKNEIDALSAYDSIIAHNTAMSGWLRKQGISGHIEEIGLFDYLINNCNKKGNTDKSKYDEIAYAGNLSKAAFLQKIDSNSISFQLNLYGHGFNESIAANNGEIKWFGSFSPEEIVKKLAGDFGLIWDGDSPDELSGLMGNYLKYNTPHKTSLYLVSGMPVIVSENAAMAAFIRENKIGICINSLHSISSYTREIDRDTYATMQENARSIAEKLKRGWYLERALAKTEEYLRGRRIA